MKKLINYLKNQNKYTDKQITKWINDHYDKALELWGYFGMKICSECGKRLIPYDSCSDKFWCRKGCKV